MKRFWLIISLLCFTSLSGNTQVNDVNFLVNSIKTGYAGFEKSSSRKFDVFLKKTIKQYSEDTFKILSEITRYFNDPHLAVYEYNQADKDTLSNSKNLQKVNQYFSDLRLKKAPYEGYWVDNFGSSVIALIKTEKRHTHNYDAYVIESRDNALPVGKVMAHFQMVKPNIYLTYYVGPSGRFRTYLVSKFRGDTVFTAGASSKWKKPQNYRGPTLSSLPGFQGKVSSRLLDSNTYLITIPRNSEENTRIVDSIIKSNRQLLSNISNLIIDIRNNNGGTTRTYNSLLPFIYTHPIVHIGGYIKYSKMVQDVVQSKLDDTLKQNTIDSAAVARDASFLAEVKRNIGKTILELGDTFKCDSIMISPKHVAIIADYGCMSAAEMMILDFKQSNKVTVFGENTFGAIDHLDAYKINFPSKKYLLSIPITTRHLTKGQTKLDGIGITPDVKISDSIPDWVEYVKNYYEKR